MHSLTYSSVAHNDFTDDELATILSEGRTVTAFLDVTGALLYKDRRFIHMIEGSEAAVRKLFAHITSDPRHTVTLATDQPISERRFTQWTVGYRPALETSSTALDGFDNFCADTFCADNFAETGGPRQNSASDIGGDHTLFDWLFSSWLSPQPERDATPERTRVEKFYRSQKFSFAETIVAADYKDGANTDAGDDANTGDNTSPNHVGESRVVAFILDVIMDEIHTGALLPGDRVSDLGLSKQLGVSRTPVREALQKLRESGMVEVAANRFTRVAVIDRKHTVQLLAVYLALFSVVLDEVIGQVGAATISAMEQAQTRFHRALADGDLSGTVSFSSEFYLLLVVESANEALQKRVRSVMNVLRLAKDEFEGLIGFDIVASALDETFAATVTGDTARAQRALASLGGTPSAPVYDPSSTWTI